MAARPGSGTPLPASPRLAIVLWSGEVGGAETVSLDLSKCLVKLGAAVTVVFIGTPEPLADRLDPSRVPYKSLGRTRGREILRNPSRYASEVSRAGPDGALLVGRGFIGAALRLGGYRAPIVTVEHGDILIEPIVGAGRRLLRRLGRIPSAWTSDIEIAVSDFMHETMKSQYHGSRTLRIYNGIDPGKFHPLSVRPDASHGATVGYAGRLIKGKGADRAIEAVASARRTHPVNLRIAGDGPERARLMRLALSLGVQSCVEFVGVVDDLTAFWGECDIATVPSDAFIESFSMVTLEAMACGKPVVASRNGAIPELVVDEVTGTLVPPGKIGALERALLTYAEQPSMREAHGTAARARAVECFDIESCARSYLDVFRELAARRARQG